MPNIFRNPGVFIQKMGVTTKTICGVSTSTAVCIGTFPKGSSYTPTNIRSLQECERTFGGLRANQLPSLVIGQFFENGGTNIWIISIGTNPFRTATPFLKGLSFLSQIPSFNMLVIPETTLLPVREAEKVFPTAVSLIEKYRAVYFLDPPHTDGPPLQVKDLAVWSSAQRIIQHPNVMVYWPRVQIRTRVASSPTVTIPVSGTMAGIFARLDSTRGVWKAPAGTEAILQGVVGLNPLLTSHDMNFLASININTIKQLPSSAFVAWGARTLSPDPEWKYVSVRRTALFVERSLQQGTTWAAFEPNDEPLWAQIRQSVETFMQTLFWRGAFQGAKAQDAYFVKCGRETTTAADQVAGQVRIIVGFAPLKPAEYVLVNIQQKAGPTPFGNRP
ncbi:MAG: phage tail sheath C-terminal domain-containing protein [Nitrospirales bacterium]